MDSLIRRFHEAAEAKAPTLTGWGIGTPLREFLNVCTGVDLTIRALSEPVIGPPVASGPLFLWLPRELQPGAFRVFCLTQLPSRAIQAPLQRRADPPDS